MQHDLLEEVTNFPRPLSGAPLPSIVSNEHQLFVLYYVDNRTPEFDGKSVYVVDADSGRQPTAVVSFDYVRTFKFGDPGHDEISSHPFFAQGLYPCAAFEVKNSSWLREIEDSELEDIGGAFYSDSPASHRHLIFTFHDSTFECICRSARAETWQISLRNAMHRCLDMLD